MAWSPQKRKVFEAGFYQFLRNAYINSKEYGRISLGDNLFDGQRKFITTVFDALEKDIHKVFVLKSRQLGLSTISRALTAYYIGMHNGMQGALVFDTQPHKDSARLELAKLIRNLDPRLKFPKVSGQGGAGNRDRLSLENESSMLFMSAGVKQSKSSGTLGRSEGLSMAHLSELCSYDNEEGLKAFDQSLSEFNPDRLYIYESTARGFNQWKDMWDVAKDDDLHCSCLFLGWWSRQDQRIERGTVDWDVYGETPPSDKEIERMDAVREAYGIEIEPEQLAWIRRKVDPSARPDGDTDAGFETEDNVMLAEQAWTEDEAFQQTGTHFFGATALTELTKKNVTHKYRSYMFWCGPEFPPRVYPAQNTRTTELKVWEEPDKDGVYILGCDPAYGENENNDRSAIQIVRCYADGMDQVAEYAWPMVTTYQLAWVIAALLGWYGQGRSEIRYILELNGPGMAVYNELKNLKGKIEASRSMPEVKDKGIEDVFKNVKTYIWQRPDSFAAGYNYHWVCLALDTKLPTPDGWTTIGAVQSGDQLFDSDGRVCTVKGTSPVHINHACYRLTFDDGTSIVADEDHLWSVSRPHWKHTYKLRKTKELRAGKHNILVSNPLDLPSTLLPIDPYVLGVWLGDGAANGGHFYADENDLVSMGENISDCGYELGPVSHDKTVSRQPIIGLRKLLKENNLLGDKHIPKQYLRASFSQRLALFQGLMDTDGNPQNSSRGDRQCSFCTSNLKLRDGFIELLRSLGFKAKYMARENRVVKVVNDRQYVAATNYQFWFTPRSDFPVFRLGRKQRILGNILDKPARRRFHRIISIEPVPSVPVKCLEVDSPTHLFLAGEGMIPTHNTNQNRKITVMERLRDFVAGGQLRVRSRALIEEMKYIARDGDKIGAPSGLKDDRVFAMSLAAYFWETKMRVPLTAARRTREAEVAKHRLSIVDQVQLFNQNHFESFFRSKRATRVGAMQQARRQMYRFGNR